MKTAKVVVMNFSGNVGKTTVAKHLLVPRLDSARLISIESINATDDGAVEDQMRGRQFGELIEALPLMDSVVVDVGASNVEDFISRMKSYKGAHEDFDYFVIPTVGKNKQIKDTIATIMALSEIGVPREKIVVIFNQLDQEETVSQVFPSVIGYHDDAQSFTFNSNAVIYASELFAKLQGATLNEVMAVDVAELKEQLKSATSDEKLAISRKISQRRLAESVQENFDQAFEALFA